MPKYSARQAELHLLLGPRGVPRPDDVMLQLKLSIDLWSGKREQLLVDLLDRATWAHARTDPLIENWKRLVLAARAELTYYFGVCGVKILMDPELRRSWQAAHREEDTYLEQLLTSPVPGIIEQMNRHHVGQGQLISELDRKWSALLYSKSELRTLEQRAVAEADRLVMQALDRNATAYKKACAEANQLVTHVSSRVAVLRTKVTKVMGEFLGKVAEKQLTDWLIEALRGSPLPPEVDQGLELAGGTIQYIANSIGIDKIQYLERLETYRYTLRYDGAVLQMFKVNRELVAAYERDNNLPKIETLRNQAVSSLRDWASGQAQPAMKLDGGVFSADIAVVLQAAYERCKTMDDNFRSKFNGLFTGPLSDQNFEILGDRYVFEQQIAGLKASGADRKLKELGEQLKVHLLSEVARSTEPIKALAADLPGAAGEWLLLDCERFRERAQKTIELRLNVLLTASVVFAQQLTMDRIASDFDRGELGRLLR